MKKMVWGLGLRAQFLFVLAVLLVSSDVKAAVFHPHYFTLANGMQIVIVPSRLSDAVAQMVWCKAGSADDPAGKSGSAHYLEHMMFKETDKLSTGGYSSHIARYGGTYNAFTGHDSTAYHVQVSKEQLGLVMQMEAERMRYLKIDAHEARVERDVVLSERQQRTENSPTGLFYEKLNKLFWGEHNYGRPVIGWRDEIESLVPADIKSFYRRFYAPNNAILVISGNVKVHDVLRLAAGTFGRLSPSKVRTKLRLKDAGSLPQDNQLVMHDPRVKQPFWIKRILAPSYYQDKKKALALEVLAEILSGGEVGLLHRHFVIKQLKAGGIDVNYDPMRRGEAVFSVIATPNSRVDVAVLAQEVEAYLLDLAQKGITKKLLKEAQQRLLDAAIFARDRLMAPAQILGSTLAVGHKVSDVEEWPARVRAVMREDVNVVLRGLVKEKHVVSGMLLPKEKGGW